MSEKNQFGQLVGDLIADWHPRKKPIADSMVGKYCVLEPLNINQHAAALFQALQVDNPQVSWTYLPYGPFATFDAFHQQLQKMVAEKDNFFYAVLNKTTHFPLGICGYININSEHGSIEVGHIHFSKALKKTAIATEAMYLMMRNVFETLQYRRYEWKCNALNQASCAAALRLGFKFEGIFRKHYVFKNRNRDTVWFSVIDEEWPLLKTRFEQWLDPKNFDGNGQQILALQECGAEKA